MAKLIFSKIKERCNDYRDYKPWLEENSCPMFCGYTWAIDQMSLSIDHYKPKEHFPELKENPDNLILCNQNCNSSKSDYHPEVTHRQVYKNSDHKIYNYREENIGKIIKLNKNGVLVSKSRMPKIKNRFQFNNRVFKFNTEHFQEIRKEYLNCLSELIDLHKMHQKAEEESYDPIELISIKELLNKSKKRCSRRYIFYKTLDIKIPKHIEKLLTNETKVKFVS